MDASQVQTLFRQAVANDDAAAFRQGLEGFLGTDGHGLSPEREYAVRRPDVVIDMPQSRERFRGRDSIRQMQEMFPEPAPVITLRKVTGGACLPRVGSPRPIPPTAGTGARPSSCSSWTATA